MYYIIPLISIIISILFSNIFSGEISDGTFRMYLTKGVSREKIYLSKLLFSILVNFILTTYILFLYFILVKGITLKMIFRYYVYTMPLYFVDTLVIMLSIILKSAPINIGICVFLIIFSSTISEFLISNNVAFIEYTYLPYQDFTIFIDKESIKLVNLDLNTNLNIYYGIFINVLFIVIHIVLGYYIFNKKDIKA
jgi:ABC-type transport system involved in multi-copper enzyme maturation permease subunit